MEDRKNRRGHTEYYTDGHLNLKDLKVKVKARRLPNQYLFKENIPNYPRPEFHVSRMKHDTDRDGLRGIRKDSGFKNPYEDGGFKKPFDEDSLLWWSLAVGPEEITDAEKRLLKTTYPDLKEDEVKNQQSFLEKFATSPAFLQTSRFGSYRFTFPVEEVLMEYSDQFCAGRPPVMRVLETELFKQEVVYVVLVHSPKDDELFSNFPLLPDGPNAVCSYSDGRFTWRSEAMCETHSYELVPNHDEQQMKAEWAGSYPEYYVWDCVEIALHVGNQVLEFDEVKLGNNLTVCEPPKKGPTLRPRSQFDNLQDAQDLVKQLWPDSGQLKEELDEIKKDE